jgi:hypothetical protein
MSMPVPIIQVTSMGLLANIHFIVQVSQVSAMLSHSAHC